MGIIKFHSTVDFKSIYPLDLGKNVEDLHWGARSIDSQWNSSLPAEFTDDLSINPHLFPTADSIEFIKDLEANSKWVFEGVILAIKNGGENEKTSDFSPLLLKSPIDLFKQCQLGIESDLKNLTRDWNARALSEEERGAWASQGVFISGPMENIYVSPGAKIRSCNLNSENGPIVLGPDSEIQEGASIRGAFTLGANSIVRMGTTIYGATSVGRSCKVGGEISNSVIHDFSNKAHHGFIGNSVLGSWCNLGAGTTSSNLKNNYSEIRVWSKGEGKFEGTGEIFCGLIMGDHSKSAINTTFNTGTIIGAFCNVHGEGISDKHLPSFTWGNKSGAAEYSLDKALETAARVMKRRGIKMTEEVRNSYKNIFKSTESDRKG